MVAMRNPLKQGLKHIKDYIAIIPDNVAMRNPLKQGLKHYNGFFKTIFYNAERGVEREVEQEVEREVEKITERQKELLDLIKSNPSISKKQMSEIIGIRPSSIDKNIVILKKKGYLSRVGSAKGGHWEITR